MRNDVKLGFAIGGVLLAVLVVYVLVVPGSGAKKVALNSSVKPAGSEGSVSLEPVAPAKPLQQTAPPSAPPQVFNPGSTGAAESAGGKENAGDHPAGKSTDNTDAKHIVKTDPFAGGDSDSANADKAKPAAPDSTKPAVAAKPAGPDWDRILNDQPTLIAQTPVAVSPPAGDAAAPPKAVADIDPPAAGPGVAIDPPLTAPKTQSSPAAGGSVDVPAAGGGRTHTVQSGETFSSIAASAYGSANFYPAIMRANPNIDPQHLKPGMKINLPDSSQVKPSGASSSAGSGSAAAPANIDSTKQYRVQPGDSLYRIAIKLYGKGTYSTKLFELNQQAMGGDETRLRPGQVLQLPEPPTQQPQPQQ